ncbi:MAG: tetratricopeptide repeat protein [Bacteroidota bacterium]
MNGNRSFPNTHQSSLSPEEERRRADEINTAALEAGLSGDPRQMIELSTEARRISRLAGYLRGVADSWLNAGIGWLKLENTQQALDDFQRALTIYERIENIPCIIETLGHLGNLYRSQNSLEIALQCYTDALRACEASKNFGRITGLHISVGDVQADLHQYDDAIESFLKALSLARELGEPDLIADSMHRLADVYLATGRHTEAVQYYHEVHGLQRDATHTLELAHALSGMARAHSALLHFEDAIDAHQKALEIYVALKNDRQAAFTLTSIAHIKQRMSLYDEAAELCLRALALAGKIGEDEVLLQIHRQFSEVYGAANKHEEALAHYRHYVELQENLLKTQRDSAFEALQQCYKLEQVTKERENISRRIIEWEHKALRMHITPHFLFNSLNSIQYFLLNSDHAMAHRYLSKFSQLMRKTLEMSRQPLVPIQDELESIELYALLEQLRFENKLSYKLNVDKSIRGEHIYVPPMILRPYIENSIWRSVQSAAVSKGTVTLSVDLDEDRNVRYTISDNGHAQPHNYPIEQIAALEEGHEFGIHLVRDHLKLLGQISGETITVIENFPVDGNGLSIGKEVEITLPRTLHPDLLEKKAFLFGMDIMY